MFDSSAEHQSAWFQSLHGSFICTQNCFPLCMAVTLPTLPIEIVELIAQALESNELFSLRLVCKVLLHKTLHPFGTCFTTIGTDLSRKSLQKLRAVSENAQLERRVQTLLIRKGEDNTLGRGFQWHRHSSGHTEGPLLGLEELQDILVHNLPNCRSFHIRSPGGSDEESDGLTPSDAIAIILRIVAHTSLPVNSFIVDFQYGYIDAKRLQMWQYRQPLFRSGWSHVQELSLAQSLMTSETFDWAIGLILHATSLRKLSLGFGFDRSASFIERLGSSNALYGLVSFSLTSTNIASDGQLRELVVRSRQSLRALSFRHVCIESGSDWPTVLGLLRGQFPSLEKFSVYWLVHYGRESGNHVMFPTLSSDPVVPGSGGRRLTLAWKKWKGERRVFGADYQGPGVDKALEMLVKAAEYI